MVKLTGLLALVLLSGCTTAEQRTAAMQAEMDRMMQVYGPACARLGYAGNTDAWRNCVLQLSAKDDLERYGYAPHYFASYGHGYWGMGGRWGPYW